MPGVVDIIKSALIEPTLGLFVLHFVKDVLVFWLFYAMERRIFIHKNSFNKVLYTFILLYPLAELT